MIVYQEEKNLDPTEFKDVLLRSTLGERRPVDDENRIREMVRHADIMVTARDQGLLVGVARSISDFVFCTYLSDLAVDEKYQRRGIGKMLIIETKKIAPKAKLILLSAPKAVEYYPRIGMSRHEHCYYIDRQEEIS